uniref:Uncharacterized protein n=1 Tax=Wuchereria bancrofti TaxID=6293 RepID=A0A1I8EZY7_WUCBA
MSSATGLTSYTVLTFYIVTKAFAIDDWISLFVASVAIMVRSTADRRLPVECATGAVTLSPQCSSDFRLNC